MVLKRERQGSMRQCWWCVDQKKKNVDLPQLSREKVRRRRCESECHPGSHLFLSHWSLGIHRILDVISRIQGWCRVSKPKLIKSVTPGDKWRLGKLLLPDSRMTGVDKTKTKGSTCLLYFGNVLKLLCGLSTNLEFFLVISEQKRS